MIGVFWISASPGMSFNQKQIGGLMGLLTKKHTWWIVYCMFAILACLFGLLLLTLLHTCGGYREIIKINWSMAINNALYNKNAPIPLLEYTWEWMVGKKQFRELKNELEKIVTGSDLESILADCTNEEIKVQTSITKYLNICKEIIKPFDEKIKKITNEHFNNPIIFFRMAGCAFDAYVEQCVKVVVPIMFVISLIPGLLLFFARQAMLKSNTKKARRLFVAFLVFVSIYFAICVGFVGYYLFCIWRIISTVKQNTDEIN
jgi:nitrate reductase NapE component